MEYRGNGLVDLRFKLIDEFGRDRDLVARLREAVRHGGSGDTERSIIFELATAVVQPFGVISANDRAKRLGTDVLDPRYCCLLEVGDALRSFDPAAHARVRDGLERLTTLDPNFAAGFSLLAALYGREYMTGFGAGPGDPPPLDRALKAARRGIELGRRARAAITSCSSILFFRGEKDAGIAAAEKAIALNPYDILITTEYRRAADLLRRGRPRHGRCCSDAVGFGAVLPSWSHFALFVGHYMRGDLAEARYHASQLTSETYVYGQLARALIAQRSTATSAEARRAKEAIFALQPAWKDDPRGEIGKVINAPAIADRLAGELAGNRVPVGRFLEPTYLPGLRWYNNA